MFGKKKKNKEEKVKKPFKETKIGSFAAKVVKEIPSIAGDVLEVATSPNPLGATLGILKERLTGVSENPSGIDKLKADSLLVELETKRMDFEAEIYELEVRDRESARNREISIASLGKVDWMMYLVGVIGLGAFVYMIYAVVNIVGFSDNKMGIHLLGMVEGVAISIFSYYYGSSKGSKDKSKKLEERL